MELETRETVLATIVRDLGQKSWSVAPQFVDIVTCAALVAEIDQRRRDRQMHAAAVGRGAEQQVRSDVRADLIFWLDPLDLTPAARVVLDRLDELRVALNRQLFLGLRGLEGHLTVYPAGGFYQKHVDNFSASAGRIVSCVVYLNAGWLPNDGGELVLYGAKAHDTDEAVVCEVTPESGTLACFLSADVPHQVRVNARARYSVTGWFLAEGEMP